METRTAAHILEPFFTTKAEGEGTGLCLATACVFVGLHDGYMGVTSEPGAPRFEMDMHAWQSRSAQEWNAGGWGRVRHGRLTGRGPCP